jgi:fluoroquinolone transport system permease protein
MKALFRSVAWDLKLQARNNILTVAIIIAAIYTGCFLGFNLKGHDDILVALIFSDPTFMGFIFTGVLVLFEKSENTLQALVVTPLRIGQYLWSKAISLTMVSLVVCFAMIIAGHGFRFNWITFFSACFLSSVFFIFLGFIGVASVKTFNQYIIVLPVFMAPLSLPFLNYFGVTHTLWFYLLPTQASLILFQASFEKVPWGELAYAYGYLVVAIGFVYWFSKKKFVKHLIREE